MTPHPADAFDTAYWWGLGVVLLTLIPCLMLLRAERPGQRAEDRAQAAEAAAEALA